MGNYAKFAWLPGCAKLQTVIMILREWKGQLETRLSTCLCPRESIGPRYGHKKGPRQSPTVSLHYSSMGLVKEQHHSQSLWSLNRTLLTVLSCRLACCSYDRFRLKGQLGVYHQESPPRNTLGQLQTPRSSSAGLTGTRTQKPAVRP